MNHLATRLDVVSHNCQFLCRCLVVMDVTIVLFWRLLFVVAVALVFLVPHLQLLLMAM